MFRGVRRLIAWGGAVALATIAIQASPAAAAGGQAGPLQDLSTTRSLSALLDLARTGPVVPAAASFVDPACSASGNVVTGSYTIPTSTGVTYEVDGAATPAGRYRAANGSTITVTAMAKPGFTLSGVTQWAHTFTTPKTCLARSGGKTGTGKSGSGKTGTGKTGGKPTTGKTGTGKKAHAGGKTGSRAKPPKRPAVTGVGVPGLLLLGFLLLAAGIGCQLAGRRGRPQSAAATAPDPVLAEVVDSFPARSRPVGRTCHASVARAAGRPVRAGSTRAGPLRPRARPESRPPPESRPRPGSRPRLRARQARAPARRALLDRAPPRSAGRRAVRVAA